MLPRKAISLLSTAALLCILLTNCGGSSSPKVTTITIATTQLSISVNGNLQFTATANDPSSNVSTNVVFTWSSSAPNIASISSPGGLALGLLPGTTQITAAANGVTSAPITLTVTPGFLPTGSMNAARSDATATLLNNGMVLIAGGIASGTYLSDAELYNPATGTFTATGSLNTARELHSATLLNDGTVLIAVGYNSNGFLTSAEIYNPTTGTFSATGSMTTARRLFVAKLLQNGKVLVAGGAGATDPLQALATAELYDPVTGTFSPTGSLNTARRLTSGTLLDNGMVLVVGGVNGSTTLSSAELYNPATGSFAFTGSLNVARLYQSATLLNNGMVLIAGGEAPSGSSYVPLSSAELYDPTAGTFTLTGSLNAARTDPVATLLNNGTVLITGGVIFSGTNDAALSSAEIYDPVAGTFATTGPLNAARADQTATLLPNGTTLVAGGFNTNGALATAELYEPASLTPAGLTAITVSPAPPTTPATPTISPNTYQRFIATGNFAGGTQQLHAVNWSSSDPNAAQISNDATNPGAAVAVPEAIAPPVPVTPISITATAGAVSGTTALNVRTTGFANTGSMSVARSFFTATVLNNGLVLMANGNESAGTSVPADLYNPATGAFSVTGSPLIPTFSHTATLLPNGMVLIAGGLTFGSAVSSAELYNPATGTFTATGNMITARYNHTATLLENGMVLIAGGLASASSQLSSAELYNPATAVFTSAGSLNFARGSHTATRLDDGTVLIAGGQGTNGVLVASGEIYNPANGSFAVTGSLNTLRSFHTASLLPNGMVLIAGGASDSTFALNSAELYDPAAGTFTVTGNLVTARSFHTATLLNSGLVLLAGRFRAALGQQHSQRGTLQSRHRPVQRYRIADHRAPKPSRRAHAQRNGPDSRRLRQHNPIHL
ncbi:MAG: kelch repeat-containing protein [Candidatus Acidiferrales bacterium]